MRKTLLVTYYFPPTIGGAEDYLYNIYKRLPNDKVVVLANDVDDDTQVSFDKNQPFKIIREKFFAQGNWPSWRHLIKKVKKIVKEQGIDVIHFGHYAHFILIARILKMPYIVYTHGSDIPSYTKSWLGKKITISNLKKAKKIIATSHFLKNQVTNLKIPENKVNVIHPALDLEKYNFNLENLRENLQYDGSYRHTREKRKIILSVGHLTRVKGFDTGIKAMPKILKQIPNAIYIIVGKGEEKQNLQNLTHELGLENKVIFTGEIKNKKELSKYYAKANLYFGPSRKEGFGIVFLEARAFGLPIVATNVGGIKEAVGDNATLTKPENIETLAQTVINTLARSNDWAKLNKKYEPEKNLGWDDKMERIMLLFK